MSLAPEPKVTVENLSLFYSEKQALRGISMTMPPNHVTLWSRRAFATLAGRHGFRLVEHRYEPTRPLADAALFIEYRFRDTLEFFGSTALHDALERAASDLASHGEGRRAVVVVTDGVDTASQRTPEEVIARSRALDVPIYVVSVVAPIDDPGSPRFLRSQQAPVAARGAELLARYAALSGGKAFTVSDFGALREAALTVAGEIKHQYRLGYDPPSGPAGFRRVEVHSTRKGVVVRTRSGYVPRP